MLQIIMEIGKSQEVIDLYMPHHVCRCYVRFYVFIFQNKSNVTSLYITQTI